MAWALQIWSHVFCRHFDPLPPKVQADIIRKMEAHQYKKRSLYRPLALAAGRRAP